MPDITTPPATLLGDEATDLIKRAQTYMDVLGVYKSTDYGHMIQINTGLAVPAADYSRWLDDCREILIEKIIVHLMREVVTEYSGKHGLRNTYNAGCRGLLCRRANREELRALQGQSPAVRFKNPDELLDEASARILPGEIIQNVHFADKVARVG